MGRVVLVTGVSSQLAGRLARQLVLNDQVDKVVGVDVVPPATDLGGVKFVRVDIRTPAIAKVLAVEEVDTVIHMDVVPHRRGGPTKETNVIGTMQLLAACQRIDRIQKLIIRSSCAVYGASPKDPALFPESHTARSGSAVGFSREVIEVESYVRGFSRRRPEITITTLRIAHMLDTNITSTLSAYISGPFVPAVMGYDPRIQLAHLEDVLKVFEIAVVEDRPGTFNVGGDGVILLSQIARRLAKPIVPLPQVGFANVSQRLLSPFKVHVPTAMVRLLMFGNVMETKALREIFGYEPQFTTADVFSEFEMKTEPGVLVYLAGGR